MCLLFVLAILLTGCGGGSSSSSNMPQVKLLVGDAPLHLPGGVTLNSVTVGIVRVEILKEADNEATKVVLFDGSTQPASLDLLSLANKSLTQLPDLGTVSIPAGHYTQLRIILNDQCSVTLSNDATTYPLTVHSGQQTGFKVNVNMDFAEGTFETILLDFNLARMHQQGNEFALTPNALRVIKISQTGSITGSVTLPEGYTLANDLVVTLSLTDELDQPVLDVEGNAITTQVAFLAATPQAAITYNLNGLPTGSYKLKVDMTYGATVIPSYSLPVTISSGQITTLNIPLQGLP
jgi:hypothetical protein